MHVYSFEAKRLNTSSPPIFLAPPIDWQHCCLTLPAIHEGRNLIYSLPTSGGKTLVAEILIMQQLLGHKKDAMLVVPYVAIVQEKVSIIINSYEVLKFQTCKATKLLSKATEILFGFG